MKRIISYLFIFGILTTLSLIIDCIIDVLKEGSVALDSHPVISEVIMLVGLVVALFYSFKKDSGNGGTPDK